MVSIGSVVEDRLLDIEKRDVYTPQPAANLD